MKKVEAKADDGSGTRPQVPARKDIPTLPPGSRYLVTGGGTGGHVYPAIAIADEIKRRDPSARFLYVGVRGKSEEKIVPRHGYPLKFVHSEGWPGARRPLALLRFSIKLTLGILESIYLFLAFRPKLVIGTGGYVSAPIMLAAIFLRRLGIYRCKTFVHEQNTFPGKLNRLVGAMVDRVGASFPESLKYFPKTGTYVGYPVRKELGGGDRKEARARLGIPEDKKVVFAFGGSQGARTINRALVAALPKLRAAGNIYVIHGSGTHKSPDYDAARDTKSRLEAVGINDPHAGFYLRQDYFFNIEEVYAAADLAVCRAGAGTLTELAARGLPSLILPKANLPGDHQVKNARALVAAGAGRVLYERVELTEAGIEEHLSGETLSQAIIDLLASPQELEAMSQAAKAYYRADALDRIGDLLAGMLDPAQEHPPQLPAPAIVPSNGPDLESMGPVALINYLSRRARSGEGPLAPADQEYLEYRTDDYLASGQWQVRNRGVKLVGLLGYRERIPLLLYLLKEKKRVGFFHRLLGGDYEQVGFIRRNIFDALVQVDFACQEVWEAIELGLDDNYFEVRSHAAAAAAHFAEWLGDDAPRLEAHLRRLLRDSSFEVVGAAILALGKVATDPAIVDDFRRFLYTKYWKVRQAVVEALEGLMARGVVASGPAAAYMKDILITSNGFQPRFPLKVELQKLGRVLNQPRALSEPAPSPEDDRDL